ncbi:gamma-glutamyltransferase [Vitreoscilla massiliensis]|uniref:Glutathione hydrolase proenzyme n=1 Tax=Vitreoscilla massiliensis TaxID=1689272 RepID=A0ABY4E6B6_9NEIS|nr:gamma-glutamyltransferase [Vitreoscilla massiliensis]UOO90891.1 gamma-glutamyltransferase [Vitreoscilla massiliensis]
MSKYLQIAVSAALISASSLTFAQDPVSGQAAYAVPDGYSAKVVEDIFKQGGNAVDAAVATAFTLAVTYPEAGNIGGGGFMTVYMNGKPYFIDYREVAPKAATKDMYLDAKGEVIENMSVVGAKAAGVPGTVMGLWEAHQRFGKLKWADVIQPAIGYAENGFTVADTQSLYRTDVEKMYNGKTNFSKYFGDLKTGVNFKQPELAKTLGRIAQNGANEFYRGETSKLLVAQMQRDGGLISAEDLDKYKVKWRKPMSFKWRDNVIHTAPLPSSGGIALRQLLAMKEYRAADFKDVPLNSAQYMHLVSEIEKRVFADRADYLGDPDYTKAPVKKLTSDAYLQKRAAEVNAEKISVTENVKPGLEPAHTTHFSILDKDGNAVANTYTLNWDYGNGVVVEGAGFLLNDEMDDFSAKAGAANIFGVVGSDANAIEPGKRMLSSMSPTIMTHDGKVNLIIGTPGGSRIFTSIFQVINNLYDYNLPLQQAVNAQRFHHQLLPKDVIYYDDYAPITGEVAAQLKLMGYTVEDQGWRLGDIQAIQVKDGKVSAASDARGRGHNAVLQP